METDIARVEAECRLELPELIAQAESITIASSADEQTAANLRTAIITRRNIVRQWFSPLIKAAFSTHRTLTSRCNAATEPYEEPLRLIDEKLTAYRDACEAARRAADASYLSGNGDELVAPPELGGGTEKVDGISYVETWAAEVTDLAALQDAIPTGAAPRACTIADMKVLNGLARSLKDAMCVPGVRVVSRKTIRSHR